MRKGKKIIAGAMAAVMLLTMTPGVSADAATKQISMNYSRKNVMVGKSVTLKVKTSKGITVKNKAFSSSNKKIAKVTKKGKVTAVKAGKAVIKTKVKYRYKGKTYTKTLKTKIVVTKKGDSAGKTTDNTGNTTGTNNTANNKANNTANNTANKTAGKTDNTTDKSDSENQSGTKKCSTHTYDKGKVTKKATCTKNGVKTYTCTVCGSTKTESIDATGHDYDEGKVTTEATCTKNGVKTLTCKNCDNKTKKTIKALGHDYASDFTVDENATCTANGSKSKHCSRCDSKVQVTSIAAAGHKYDSGKVTTEATCVKDGVKTYTCENCGGTKTEAIAKTGHKYDSGKITTEATCVKDGVKTYTCENCGGTKTEAIAKTGHKYDSGKITTEATCKAEGVKTYTCVNCGDTKTETIAKAEHKYDSGKVTTAATCKAEGVKTYTCSVCGDTKTESIEKIEHTYSWQNTSGSTSKWILTQICSVCSARGESKKIARNDIITSVTQANSYENITIKSSQADEYYVALPESGYIGIGEYMIGVKSKESAGKYVLTVLENSTKANTSAGLNITIENYNGVSDEILNSAIVKSRVSASTLAKVKSITNRTIVRTKSDGKCYISVAALKVIAAYVGASSSGVVYTRNSNNYKVLAVYSVNY